MTREQFLEAVRLRGYARKKTAERYAEGKDRFTDDDFIAVYRMEQDEAENMSAYRERFRDCWQGDGRHRTTKRYKHDGGLGQSVGNIGM